MTLKRILSVLAVLIVATSAQAASVADRSPFAQGLWWDPTKSGHGFQIFNASDQAMVVWYTYDNFGQPTWYTAQGNLASVGDTWPLLQHRWANGHKADPTQVGTLRLNVRQPEAADLVWTIGTTQGTWSIQPFIVSGVVNEVDHSGLWFDPSNSGWGFSLLEQGNVMGGILYGYDVSGAPTWAAGFDRTPGRVQLFAYRGPCPVCAYQPPSVRGVGQLSFDFQGEAELTFHSNFPAEMAVGTNIDGARAIQLTRPASWRPADRQLANFDTEARLKAYLDAGMLAVPPFSSGADFSAAPPSAAPYSPTNLQESGVDEADLVKTDGRFVYTYASDTFGTRLPAIRVAEVGDDGATLSLKGTVQLASGLFGNDGLYLDGETLVSVSSTRGASWWGISSWARGTTRIEVMNTSGGGIPVARWRADIDGQLVSSRRVGSRLYVISRFVPYIAGFRYGSTDAMSLIENRDLLMRTALSAMLPEVRINGGGGSPAIGVGEIYAPPPGSRPPMADMILVTSVDLAGGPRIAQTMAIAGTADAAYASTENLYVAGARSQLRNANGLMLPVETTFTLTDVHQIRLGATAMTIVGSGSLEGFLATDAEQAAFRLSEYQGRLRAVTSSNSSMWGGPQKNRLTILEPSTRTPGLLKTVSYLPNATRPQTLGKPSELLYSTRFLGDRLYAVTFKKVDPLYIVDIADSADPKIAGAVQVPGFSDYLHPLANGLLIGFGKDALPADTTGDAQFAWYQGLKLTLFDVSDASQPRELQSVVYGKRGSDSPLLRDHHAFSILPNTDGSTSIAFPARLYDGTPIYNSPSSSYPYQQSGLMRIELLGADPSNARLVQTKPNLITNTPANAPGTPLNYSYADPTDTGRSILFRNGALFIGNGKFWRQDSLGNASGPF